MSELATFQPPIRSNLILVLGVDGVGKSTFLNGLHDRLDFNIIEPTTTAEARDFKARNLGTVVTSEFIDQRRSLYMGISKNSDSEILQMTSDAKVATTGCSLVTIVSHDLMSKIVDPSLELEYEKMLLRWKATSLLLPECVVLIHAPQNVINRRIMERQQDGQTGEGFWGFNSPHFLASYQMALRNMVDVIAQNKSIACLDLDSSVLEPEEMLDHFERHIENRSA